MKIGASIKKSWVSLGRSVMNSWWGPIKESFSGAWQKNIEIDNRETVLAYSAVYACVTGIALDISKLKPMVVKYDENDISKKLRNHPLSTLLKNPNHYQGWIKFLEQWIVSLLLNGNAYILKVRTGNKITGLYVLDPHTVTPMVSERGEIYYKLSKDNLSKINEITVPASEIIHDMYISLFHPLIGVSPIYACAKAATIGGAITNNSTSLFKNLSQPGGLLLAPQKISDETAKNLKAYWEANYSNSNIGKIAVLGDDLKYQSMAMNAVDSELINQLKWTVEDVSRAFRYPLYKLSTGQEPKSNTVESLGVEYYQNCLQPIIERLEECLNQGLEIRDGVETELDLTGLYRMDTDSLYRSNSEGISGGWLSPNEARKKANLPPVKGGDSPFLQQQNYSLADLEKLRAQEQEALNNPPAPAPAPAPMPTDNQQDPEKVFEDLIKTIKKGFSNAN